MLSWFVAVVIKPILPILIQTYKVLFVVTSSLKVISPNLGSIKITNLYNALKVVQLALEYILKFAKVDVTGLQTLSDTDLQTETEKLRKLIR